ncbi:MAG: LamG domain-containing protein [Candidatus Diapherotrites archaeon]|nr:LamG domain-containing protein [Candidatus Diapherotrites archaeon]
MNLDKIAQGTTEYLVVLAVVVVIALVLAGVLGFFPGFASSISESESKAYWQSVFPLAVVDYFVDSNGSVLLQLQNNSFESLTVNEIYFNGLPLGSGSVLVNAGSKGLVSGSAVCVENEVYSFNVKIDYDSPNISSKNLVGLKPLIGVCEKANNASLEPVIEPELNSIDLNVSTAGYNELILVTGNGSHDGNVNLDFFCSTTSNPSNSNKDFCEKTDIALPYSDIECIGTTPGNGSGNQTIYCVLFDGENYSDVETDSFVLDDDLIELTHLFLTASTDNNSNDDDLICNYALNSNALSASIHWYKNNDSLTVLNMPFEGGAVNSLNDYSGNNNAGTNVNAVWSSSNGFDLNGAYAFTGTEYILINHSVSLNLSKGITMEAWLYPTQFKSDGIILGKPHTSFSAPYLMYGLGYASSNNRYDIALADGGSQRNCPTPNNAVQLNSWQHVVATFNGTTAKIYVNGVQASSCNFTPFNIRTNSEPLYLGYYPFGSFNYAGRMDSVKIYDFALSPEQILALYNTKGDLIVSQETDAGNVWKCEVTPFNSSEAGNTETSNELTVLD